MNKVINNLLVGFLLFLGSDTISGTIDPNVQDKEYIEYGAKFDYVLEIMGSYEKNRSLFTASAVAIDPNWVLTAAHVVKGSRFVFLYDENEKRAILVDEVITHKDFEDKEFGFADIALCHTTSDIGLTFYPQLYEGEDEVNKICSISGYGQTGTFDTGIHISDGKKRAGSNKVDKIENNLLICYPSKVNKTSLEFLIGSGDSGGGLFIDGKLAGINSCVMSVGKKPNSTYNDHSGHTRVSKFLGWIKDNIQKKKEQVFGLPP
jgi:hypothetical protein